MIRALLIAALMLPAATPIVAETDLISARSVLQISCFREGGETRATGFVWPEPGYMVTALHAVAGCENGIVFSEHLDDDTTISRIVAVDLEPDLALVELADVFDLPALLLSDAPLDTGQPHFIWGYPLAAARIMRDQVRFSSGLAGDLTTLGGAYSSDDLRQLFRAQDYPTRDTQILRVASLLQHGQSGAPIFNAQGHVIAIADGGLLGGWRGMNWSVPAHIYLPGLPESQDEVPSVASRQSLLMSSYAVRDQTVIQLGGATVDVAPLVAPEIAAQIAPETAPEAAIGEFLPVGQFGFGEVIDYLAQDNPGRFEWVFDALDGVVPEAAWNEYGFEVMERPADEEWIVVPAGARVTTDPASGTLEAVSTDGAVVYFEVLLEAESFEAALREGLDRLDAHAAGFAGATALPTPLLPEESIDRLLEFVDHESFHEVPNSGVAFDVVIEVNGPFFSGRLVHTDRYLDEMSDADRMDFEMMRLAAFDLNSFENIFDAWNWIDLPASDGDVFRPEPSALTLVRRVPLEGVAADFVADQNFAWKTDLAYLRSKLSDPSDFDALHFDVYEDWATGATVAVPEGLALAWNPDLGAVEGVTGGGRVRLAIALHQGESFDDVTGANVFQFIDGLNELADWDGPMPTDCEPEIDVIAQRAECWSSFGGTDRGSDEIAELFLALTAQENVFLGTSVYIIGEEDDLADDEIVAYLMALIGAEYLSDFAVH